MRPAALLALLLGFAGAEILAAPGAAATHEDQPSLQCDLGPVERYYAGIQWHVFACDDGASVVVITGPKSPEDLAFYFILFPEDGDYQLAGEGNGDKALTRPAFEALSEMSPNEIRALHAEASAQGRADASPSLQ